jgi:hypothetical protein
MSATMGTHSAMLVGSYKVGGEVFGLAPPGA